jgi:hypothetical protein
VGRGKNRVAKRREILAEEQNQNDDDKCGPFNQISAPGRYRAIDELDAIVEGHELDAFGQPGSDLVDPLSDTPHNRTRVSPTSMIAMPATISPVPRRLPRLDEAHRPESVPSPAQRSSKQAGFGG